MRSLASFGPARRCDLWRYGRVQQCDASCTHSQKAHAGSVTTSALAPGTCDLLSAIRASTLLSVGFAARADVTNLHGGDKQPNDPAINVRFLVPAVSITFICVATVN